MASERTYYCDWENCHGAKDDGGPTLNMTTASEPPHLPIGLLEVRTRLEGRDYFNHFCGWDCLMHFAAANPLGREWTLGDDGEFHQTAGPSE